jgi:hypothetical protein
VCVAFFAFFGSDFSNLEARAFINAFSARFVLFCTQRAGHFLINALKILPSIIVTL